MANDFSSAEALLKCSVIVPIFNHWDLIPDLLDSLKCQTLDQVHFEVLLVDNGSAFVPSDLKLEPNTSILYCSIPGSYAARNMAIKQANGKIIAFTDADCRPSYSWLKNGLDHFHPENSASLIVAGAISVEPKNWDNLTPAESYDIALGLPQQRYTKRGYGVTANLFVPKVLFNKYGYFDQRRFSGGDAEFCRRALKHQVILNYCKNAVVIHPARRTWDSLEKKVRRVKGGQIKAGKYRRRIAFALRTLLPPIRAWHQALKTKRLPIKSRIHVCWLQSKLWLVELRELCRLLSGGKSTRD
ncbi:MAG: glycosyltransferase family 2 protein [Desulfobulbaceae bacterium]|nr:glycosyltransferase family 2 protein [Desulfobulbaceae bacterium]